MSIRPAPYISGRRWPIRFIATPLIACAVVASALCAPGYDGSPSGPGVTAGLWGGDHMRLTVTATGAEADFDCAHGAIASAITLDRSGRFDVAGTHTPERPGPQREGDAAQPQPASYAGRVQGKTMTVTITITGSRDVLGPFTLVQGQSPRITKCL